MHILKRWIWSLCSPARIHWGGSCGRWEGWDRGRPLRLPRHLKEVSSGDCIEHKSFCFCFCFQKSLNSEFEGLSKLVCVDVVVALVFKATEVRQWTLLCNISLTVGFCFLSQIIILPVRYVPMLYVRRCRGSGKELESQYLASGLTRNMRQHA